MRNLILCLLISALLPGCAAAQHSDSVLARNRCRLALQIIETGHPEPHTAWAYERVGSCGPEAGPAVAGALRRFRMSEDTVELHVVTTPARYLRDGRIFEAALDISQDPAASTEARVFAFWTLIQAKAPGTLVGYADLTEPSGPGRSCFGLGPHLHQETAVGAALPADYITTIQNAATAVLSDPASAQQVRRAATCALLHSRV